MDGPPWIVGITSPWAMIDVPCGIDPWRTTVGKLRLGCLRHMQPEAWLDVESPVCHGVAHSLQVGEPEDVDVAC